MVVIVKPIIKRIRLFNSISARTARRYIAGMVIDVMSAWYTTSAAKELKWGLPQCMASHGNVVLVAFNNKRVLRG